MLLNRHARVGEVEPVKVEFSSAELALLAVERHAGVTKSAQQFANVVVMLFLCVAMHYYVFAEIDAFRDAADQVMNLARLL